MTGDQGTTLDEGMAWVTQAMAEQLERTGAAGNAIGERSHLEPTLTAVLSRAKEGGWDEVARATEGTLRFAAPSAGAYRVEVRIVPRHLRPWAGAKAGWLRAERPWVMSSALYVE